MKKTNEYVQLGIEFEKFCKEMLISLGYNINSEVEACDYYQDRMITPPDKILYPDIKICSNDKSVYIEIKIYRTITPDYSMLVQAVEQIKQFSLEKSKTQFVLLIANPIKSEIITDIKSTYGVDIIDKSIIENSIYDNQKLLNSFYYFTSCIPQTVNPSQYQSNSTIFDIIKIVTPKSKKNINQYKQQYQTFEQNLKNIKPGKKDASKYEKLITDILKYLFEKDLSVWASQLMTDDGLYKYDLVCRINPGNTFWDSLISDFHSRYVVFEFKNYNEQIKQTQIYTTEKYLYKTALRNICFLIARNGADKNAIKASKGVLRETGKLLIILSEKDLLNMVALKDKGDSPSDYLYELLDKYLLKIEK